MASRYGNFARSARSAFRQYGSSTRGSNFRNANPNFVPQRSNVRNQSPSFIRRRLAETLVPLHNAVANATLVSHLSSSSRNHSALSPGLLRAMGLYDKGSVVTNAISV